MINKKKKVLVTGAAGFIGAALAKKLLEIGSDVLGIDDLNSYYDPDLKRARLKNISNFASSNSLSWSFNKISLEDEKELNNIFLEFKPKIVVISLLKQV